MFMGTLKITTEKFSINSNPRGSFQKNSDWLAFGNGCCKNDVKNYRILFLSWGCRVSISRSPDLQTFSKQIDFIQEFWPLEQNSYFTLW